MSAESRRSHARDYVIGLAESGRYHFTSREARKALGVSPDATKQALYRLGRQGLVASPARGFYVVVPPEYRSLDCLPADQFIPALMQSLGQPYYVGLLSAAQYHGAAHHRPQEFQVLLNVPRRPIRCGKVRVSFIVRNRLTDVAVQSINTPRGTIRVSTPEATAVDLVGYSRYVGGLDQTATLLSELAESIDQHRLLAAAMTAPVAWAQRLGYLLESVGAGEKVSALRDYVVEVARQAVPLLPGAPVARGSRDALWKVVVNVEVEAEL
jgi:predicted transcriptional regulator of viral defense system